MSSASTAFFLRASVPQLVSLSQFARQVPRQFRCIQTIGERNGVVANHSKNMQCTMRMSTSACSALPPEPEPCKDDEFYMAEALLEAKKAAAAGEVPVGAVLVSDGRIVSRAHNGTATTGSPIAHAEILCIQQAAAALESWRLLKTTLYVTLEPCTMCAGALLQARVGTVVYGARNTLAGADGSWVQIFPSRSQTVQAGVQQRPHPFHPNMQVRRGVRAAESTEILKNFFRWRRTQPYSSETEEPVPPAEIMIVSHEQR